MNDIVIKAYMGRGGGGGGIDYYNMFIYLMYTVGDNTDKHFCKWIKAFSHREKSLLPFACVTFLLQIFCLVSYV